MENPKVLDVGCGASCIYALLGAKRFKWHFHCLESCPEQLECAMHNVHINNLQEMISVTLNQSNDILPLEFLKNQSFDVLMCNPPFYADKQDLEKSRKFKAGSPGGTYGGTNCELYTNGGELAFCKNLIDSSLSRGSFIKLFSCLIAFKSHFVELQDYLVQKGILNSFYRVIALGQTKRWILFWHTQNL